MNRLTLLMFTIIAPSMAGLGVIIALVTGNDTLTPILIAAALGFVAGFPVSYFVSKKIADL
ncbi:hypothetical protein [Falsihalocynthiibacter arcticus]|uniref:CTP synthetase n=1 Tax=Falsihalocynthiibacter arcticus TaxID=1579316 RepID=A0A126UX70_9RHOB|nr:hypothetical protein [Falsihalocynthiibacter arcticus]AML50236.1 CTP synthetase [Falsihalocynthiibacter arcticus]